MGDDPSGVTATIKMAHRQMLEHLRASEWNFLLLSLLLEDAGIGVPEALYRSVRRRCVDSITRGTGAGIGLCRPEVIPRRPVIHAFDALDPGDPPVPLMVLPLESVFPAPDPVEPAPPMPAAAPEAPELPPLCASAKE